VTSTRDAGSALPPVRDWLPLLRQGLAQEGSFRWRLVGNSMRPTLPGECQIDIVPLGRRVPLGSLIVFANGSALVAHRLVRKGRRHWVAQGDSRLVPDPLLPPDQVLGVVVAAYRQDGTLCWPTRLSRAISWWWIARAYGLWVLRRAWRLLPRPRTIEP
jgi:hypothetical protein